MLLTPFTLGVYKRGSARVRPTLFPRCAPPVFDPLHRGQCSRCSLCAASSSAAAISVAASVSRATSSLVNSY